MGAICLCVFDKIGVAVIKAKILKAIVQLLPLDHTVSVIAKDQNHQIHFKSHCGFQFLGVHHEPTITANGHYPFVGVDKSRRHGRWQARTHGCQRIIK